MSGEDALRYAHIASLVFDQPLLITPRKADLIARYLAARIVGAEPPLAVDVPGTTRRDRAKLQTVDGVAVIDVSGVLVHRAGQIDADSAPILSYEQLGLELDTAVRSPEVRGILLRVDSEGGEVNGAFDLADRVFNARKQKPVWAVAADVAASAAYLLASAAERVIVSQSAITGSIGVVLNRLDVTKALEAEGVQVIQIAQGARKLDGSPVQPWREGSAEDKALRAFTARYYDMFVNAVARYRGLSAKAVRETDAAVFIGADAVQEGLATQMGPLELAMNELQAFNTGRVFMTTGRQHMDRLTREQIEAQYPEIVAAIRTEAAAAVLTKEQLLAQCPELVAALRAEGLEEGKAAIAQAERARILKIQELGRGHAALAAACITDGSSPEQAALKIREADIAAQGRHLTLLQGDEAAIDAPTPLAVAGEAGPVREPNPAFIAAKAQHHIKEQKAQGISVDVPTAVAHVRQMLGLPSHLTLPGAQP